MKGTAGTNQAIREVCLIRAATRGGHAALVELYDYYNENTTSTFLKGSIT
jgi:hypothetical protein